MTYVVLDNCIMCKYTDCVDVCPVDCFYEGPNMLVINPEECIDCGVCVPECPADAIRPESEDLIDWIDLNRSYAKKWPVIIQKKLHITGVNQYNGEENKLQKYGLEMALESHSD